MGVRGVDSGRRRATKMNQGPLVHRTVRSGAAFFVFGAVEFIVGMVAVQSQYPGYSLSQNYISDLGGAHSPWALVFDASVIVLGICAILGALLVWSAFDPRPSRGLGLGFLFIGGIGAIGVGVFPETTPVLNGGMHVIVSAIAFVGAGIGLTVLSFAMAPGPHWRYSRPFTLACGAVTLAATVLFEVGADLGLGPGGMERLIVAPILLWAIAEGIHIARLPRFAPSMPLKAPA
jgi:hypothetical membrane protein